MIPNTPPDGRVGIIPGTVGVAGVAVAQLLGRDAVVVPYPRASASRPLDPRALRASGSDPPPPPGSCTSRPVAAAGRWPGRTIGRSRRSASGCCPAAGRAARHGGRTNKIINLYLHRLVSIYSSSPTTGPPGAAARQPRPMRTKGTRMPRARGARRPRRRRRPAMCARVRRVYRTAAAANGRQSTRRQRTPTASTPRRPRPAFWGRASEERQPERRPGSEDCDSSLRHGKRLRAATASGGRL